MASTKEGNERERWVRTPQKDVVGTTKYNPLLPALPHKKLHSDSLKERNTSVSTQFFGAFHSEELAKAL